MTKKKNTVYIPTYRSYTWLALLHTRVAQNPATKTMAGTNSGPNPPGPGHRGCPQ